MDSIGVQKDSIAYRTIGCAMRVYKALGPGLLESVYQGAMMIEMNNSGLFAQKEVPIDVVYLGTDLGLGFRMDIVVENMLVLELKSVPALMDIHYKQLLNYLRLANLPMGYVINFNVEDFALGEGFDKVKNYKYRGLIPPNLI